MSHQLAIPFTRSIDEIRLSTNAESPARRHLVKRCEWCGERLKPRYKLVICSSCRAESLSRLGVKAG